MLVTGHQEGSAAQWRKLMRKMYSDVGTNGAQAYWVDWVRWRPGRGSGLARRMGPVGLGSREGFKMGMDF
jgi:hypothetical protein